MELTPWTFAIVLPLVALAGFVDAAAGGGGLISLPAYLAAGLPAQLASGTNKMGSVFGTALATAKYAREGRIAWRATVPAVVGALPGLMDAVEGNFVTNLPREQILALAPSLAGGWDISTYTTAGLSDYQETWSMPGANLYVILPDQQSVAQEKEILEEVLQGEA